MRPLPESTEGGEMNTYPRGVPALRDEVIQLWKDYGTTMLTRTEGASPAGEIHCLRQAELVWVSADMCRLWNVAEKSLPTDTVLKLDDLPSDFGFVVLEEALESIDSVREKEDRMKIRAFTWSLSLVGGPAGDPAVHLSFYTDVERFEELHAAPEYRAKLVYIGNSDWFLKTEVDDFTNKVYADPRLWDTSGHGPPPRVKDSITEDRRRLATLLLLLQQPIVVDTISRPRRAELRQAARNKMFAPDVRVLTLRERKYRPSRPEESHAVDWSHRWMVEGHWRWQWYPSIQDHKRIWIFAYQKGPWDKELLIRPTVRAWRR